MSHRELIVLFRAYIDCGARIGFTAAKAILRKHGAKTGDSCADIPGQNRERCTYDLLKLTGTKD